MSLVNEALAKNVCAGRGRQSARAHRALRARGNLRGDLALGLHERDAVPRGRDIVLVLPPDVVAGAEREREGAVDGADVVHLKAGFEMRAAGGFVGAATAEQFAAQAGERLLGGEEAKDAVTEKGIAARETALAHDVDHPADGIGGHVGRGDFRDFDAIHVGDVGGGEARPAAGGAVAGEFHAVDHEEGAAAGHAAERDLGGNRGRHGNLDTGNELQKLAGIPVAKVAELLERDDVFDIGRRALLLERGGLRAELALGDGEGVEFHDLGAGNRSGRRGGIAGGEIEVMARGLPGGDGEAHRLRIEPSRGGAEGDGAGGHTGEPEFAGLVGERFEAGIFNNDAHLFEKLAGGGVRNAAFDHAGRDGLAGGGANQRGAGEQRQQETRKAEAAKFGGHG